MIKIRNRFRIRIYLILWSIIILVSIYILIRFATILFSEDMDQASFRDALISKLCTQVIGWGDSLVSYTDKGTNNTLAFPYNIVGEQFALERFTKDNAVEVANIQNNFLINVSKDPSEQNRTLAYTSVSSNNKGVIGFYKINYDNLGLEYILSNGDILRSKISGILIGDKDISTNQLQIEYVQGELSKRASANDPTNSDGEAVESVTSSHPLEFSMEQLKDINFLVRNFYIVDAGTKVTDSLFNAEKLMGKDMRLKQTNDAPQILIYHTHATEDYADSNPGEEADTVVGVGSYLTQILEEKYGYNVIHDTSCYSIVDGKSVKDAYLVAIKGLNKILKENPSIEVVIDLHRDSGDSKTTIINGVETAQIMLFNGLCRDQEGPLPKLENPYIQDNLALSLQLQLKSMEVYNTLFIKNYLKAYRYNMHVRPKCLLVELGTEGNTLQSAKNAVVPFADILNRVLMGEKVAVMDNTTK